jgi:hypothetical protein
MPELGPYGSVRGALSNERPYRDLRNVVAKYPFERSHRFPEIQPNSRDGDYSRLSCGVRETQLRPNARISAGMLARALVNRSEGRNCRDFCRSKDDAAAANPQAPALA